MKLTNHHNLPQTFVNVIQRPTYSKGRSHISATELINSPRIVQLKQQYWDDLEQDASEMVWALFGSACHHILEHGKDPHHIVEQRLHTEFEGWSITGAIDLQEVEEDGIIISDYKVTGAWAAMNQKVDWVNQLNIYAWLVEKVKRQSVKGIQIIAIIRDWSAREAKTKEGYPQAPVATLPLPLWSFQEREDYIRGLLRSHSEALLARSLEESLPECTPEQMWEKPTSWAIQKEGNKRASSVHETKEEAQRTFDQIKDQKLFSIVERPGERTRCATYCQVAKFCDQYQRYLKEQASE
jgi:hypothetical protein